MKTDNATKAAATLRSASVLGGAIHDPIGQRIADAFVRHFDLPIIAIDSSDTIRWVSQGASDRLRPPLPMFLDAGRLHIDEHSGWASLSPLRAAFSEERRQVLVGDVAGSNWIVLSGWHETIGDERLLVLAFRMAIPLSNARESGLAQQFRLTHAQCAVLDRFARLRPPQDIADDLGLTVHTVRSHLKTIHAKLGVRSNTQLLQLVRAYCDA